MGHASSTALEVHPERVDNFVVSDKVLYRMAYEETQAKLASVSKNKYESGPENVGNLILDALDALDDVSKNKNYWKERLESMDSAHAKITEVLETEKERGFQDVQGSLPPPQQEEQDQACKDTLSGVISCYQSNAEKPLTCSPEVKEFVSCVKNKDKPKADK